MARLQYYYIGWFLCMAQVRFLEICVLIVLPLLVHDASDWLRPCHHQCCLVCSFVVAVAAAAVVVLVK